jgi:hypothetical protein
MSTLSMTSSIIGCVGTVVLVPPLKPHSLIKGKHTGLNAVSVFCEHANEFVIIQNSLSLTLTGEKWASLLMIDIIELVLYMLNDFDILSNSSFTILKYLSACSEFSALTVQLAKVPMVNQSCVNVSGFPNFLHPHIQNNTKIITSNLFILFSLFISKVS